MLVVTILKVFNVQVDDNQRKLHVVAFNNVCPRCFVIQQYCVIEER